MSIHSEIVRWVNAVTQLQTIQAYQGSERPSEPYCMVQFVSRTDLTDSPQDITFFETDRPNVEGQFEIEATPLIDQEWTFMVFGYGRGALAAMVKLSSARQLTQILEPAYPVVTIHDISGAMAIPEFIDQTWEERYQVTLIAHVISQFAMVIDTIDYRKGIIELS